MTKRHLQVFYQVSNSSAPQRLVNSNTDSESRLALQESWPVDGDCKPIQKWRCRSVVGGRRGWGGGDESAEVRPWSQQSGPQGREMILSGIDVQ